MKHDVMVVRVVEGHATLDQPFVYCWLHPQEQTIIYVGATWLHPAARAELHLQGLDPEARIVGENLTRLGLGLNQAMKMLAFPVPQEWDRQTVRHHLIAALAREKSLSDVYFGPAPDEMLNEEMYRSWIEAALEDIKASPK